MSSRSNSLDDNPFAIFKRYRVSFKDEKMEQAYQRNKIMIKPFNILKLLIYYEIILTVGLFAILGLIYLGYLSFSPRLYIYFSFSNLGALIVLIIYKYIVNRFPKYHNYYGSFGILLLTMFMLESNLQIRSNLFSFIALLSIQPIIIMVLVEYISSLRIGIITLFVAGLYSAIRLISISNNNEYLTYIHGGINIFVLNSFTMYGLIRWRKVTYFQLYSKVQVEKNFKKAMNILPNGIIILKQKCLSYYNQVACELLNIHPELNTVETKRKLYEVISEILHISRGEDINLNLNTSYSEIGNEELYTTSDKLLSITKKSIMYEETQSWLIAIKDMTLVRDLEESKSQIKYKGMLMATISHDMRAPVTSTLGMLKILQKYIPSDQMKYLEIANSSLALLLHLIHDMLDFSKIENNQIVLNLEPFRINEAIEEVLDMVRYQMEMKHISLKLRGNNDHYEILGDRKRIQQILLNLLTNAIKFTLKGKIKLSIWEDSPNSKLFFQVSDSGVGIKEKDLSKLFQAFGMISDTKNINKFGSGLGLYLCKNLCKLMDGDINVSSIYGKGTKFTFWISTTIQMNRISSTYGNVDEGEHSFEIKMNPGRGGQTIAQLDPMWSNRELLSEEHRMTKRVFIVDDDPFNLFTTEKLLELLGVKSTTVSNGAEAIENIRDNLGEYAFILMDCNMPIMDGLEATAIIRDWLDREQIPIIGLTGYENDQQLISKCSQAGMNQVASQFLLNS